MILKLSLSQYELNSFLNTINKSKRNLKTIIMKKLWLSLYLIKTLQLPKKMFTIKKKKKFKKNSTNKQKNMTINSKKATRFIITSQFKQKNQITSRFSRKSNIFPVTLNLKRFRSCKIQPKSSRKSQNYNNFSITNTSLTIKNQRRVNIKK